MGTLTQAASDITRSSLAAQQQAGELLLRKGTMEAQHERAIPQALLGAYDAYNAVADTRFKRQEMEFKSLGMEDSLSMRKQLSGVQMTPETLSGLTADMPAEMRQLVMAVKPQNMAQFMSLLDGTAPTIQKMYQYESAVGAHSAASENNSLWRGQPISRGGGAISAFPAPPNAGTGSTGSTRSAAVAATTAAATTPSVTRTDSSSKDSPGAGYTRF
jgi:hypothetical protein